MVQLVLASEGPSSPAGLSNPWTEYIKFLPPWIPLPTLWTEDEQALLRGTSLEPALAAKLRALNDEFEALKEASSEIFCWNDMFWGDKPVSWRDWVYLDALYRSRVLELPKSGESLVPCLDMANHSAEPTAYYEENSKDEVTLLLRPGITVPSGGEVTISYGEAKSAAELLFSYGFLDPSSSSTGCAFPLEPFPDDPLARAKIVAFGQPPLLHVSLEDGAMTWKSPFAYLMCVNEEDGLDFRLLQDNEGNRQLRVFWQDQDVTDRTEEFETIIQGHPLREILKLRVLTVVQECLQSHVESMHVGNPPDAASQSATAGVRQGCAAAASQLRDIETNILESAVRKLEEEVSEKSLHPLFFFFFF